MKYSKDGMRCDQDFADENPMYKCECQMWRTAYPQNYSKCPYCGVAVEIDET